MRLSLFTPKPHMPMRLKSSRPGTLFLFIIMLFWYVPQEMEASVPDVIPERNDELVTSDLPLMGMFEEALISHESRLTVLLVMTSDELAFPPPILYASVNTWSLGMQYAYPLKKPLTTDDRNNHGAIEVYGYRPVNTWSLGMQYAYPLLLRT